MGSGKWKSGEPNDLSTFFKSIGGTYKRIRKRCKSIVDPVLYACEKAYLGELEKLSQQKILDLYYGDESCISSEHGAYLLQYVPYGWQFKDERVSVPTGRGYKINLFGLISRTNQWQ